MPSVSPFESVNILYLQKLSVAFQIPFAVNKYHLLHILKYTGKKHNPFPRKISVLVALLIISDPVWGCLVLTKCGGLVSSPIRLFGFMAQMLDDCYLVA